MWNYVDVQRRLLFAVLDEEQTLRVRARRDDEPQLRDFLAITFDQEGFRPLYV